MDFPEDLKYSHDHEWVRVNGNEVVCGITDFAQGELGDIVYVELPKVGDNVEKKKACAVIESVKTASDIFAPVSGKVVQVNEALTANPANVNSSPYEQGWLFKLEISQPDELNSLIGAEEYSSQYAKS